MLWFARNLRSQEKFAAVDPAFLDGFAYHGFVAVRNRRIKMPIPKLDGSQQLCRIIINRTLVFSVFFPKCIRPTADHWNLNAGIQFNRFHAASPFVLFLVYQKSRSKGKKNSYCR